MASASAPAGPIQLNELIPGEEYRITCNYGNRIGRFLEIIETPNIQHIRFNNIRGLNPHTTMAFRSDECRIFPVGFEGGKRNKKTYKRKSKTAKRKSKSRKQHSRRVYKK